jgi:hypothetical protein
MKKVCAYVGENNSSVAFVWDVDGFAAFRSGGVWNTAAGLEMADLPDGYSRVSDHDARELLAEAREALTPSSAARKPRELSLRARSPFRGMGVA